MESEGGQFIVDIKKALNAYGIAAVTQIFLPIVNFIAFIRMFPAQLYTYLYWFVPLLEGFLFLIVYTILYLLGVVSTQNPLKKDLIMASGFILIAQFAHIIATIIIFFAILVLL